MPRPHWAIRTAQVAAVGVLLAIVLALAVHAPPIRRAALDRIVSLLAERFDVVLRADRIDYNLLTLRASLTKVEVAAAGQERFPFLTADRLDIDVPGAVLLGRFSIDRLALENARIDVQRRADGSSNLPRPAPGGEAGEPGAVPIGRLRVRRLAVTVADEPQGFRLDLPEIAVDVGPTDGSLRLTRDGRVQAGDIATAVTALGGGVAFDGRSMHLTNFVLTVPEASLETSGTLTLLAADPRLDLRLSGRSDLRDVRRLVPDLPALSGQVVLGATLAGPLAAPTAGVRLTSDSLALGDLALTSAQAALAIDASAVRLTELGAATAGGKIAAAGSFDTAARHLDLTLSWNDIDLPALARALNAGGPPLAARATGSARMSGAGADPREWTLDANTQLTPRPRAPGHVAIDARAALRASAGRWSLEAAGEVERVPVRAALGGRLTSGGLAAATLSGTVAATGADIPAVLASLGEAGLLDVPDDAIGSGRADARAVLSGTLGAPGLELTASASDVAAGGVSGLAATVTATGTLTQLAVDARVSQAATATEATAAGTIRLDDRRVNVRIAGTVREPQTLLPAVPVGGTAAFDLQVQGPFDAVAATGNVTVAGATVSGFDLGELRAAVSATTGAARVDLTAADLNARAQADVTLGGTRQAAVTLQVDGAAIERLLRGVETPAPVSGTLSLGARGTVPFDDWRRGSAELDLTALEARVGELPVRLAAPAHAMYAGEIVDVASLEADVGRARLSVAGRIAASDAAPDITAAEGLRALLVGDVAHVIDAVEAAGFAEPSRVEARGQVALVARVTGSIPQPVLAADLDVANAVVAIPDLPPVSIRNGRATLANGWIERFTATAEWQGARLEADARVPLGVFRAHLPAAVVAALPAAGTPGVVNARVSAITPAVLAPFVDAGTLSQLGGTIDAAMRLESTSLDPRDLGGEVRLDRLDLQVAGLPVTQQTPTRVSIERGVARVTSWQWRGGGSAFDVEGQLDLAEQQADVRAAGRLDLRLLAPFVRAAGVTLAGTLAPRVAVNGPLRDLRIDGSAVLADTELRLADPRLVVTGVNAFATLAPTEIRITSLDGVANGGTLSGGGALSYGGGRSPAGQLRVMVDGMGLELPDGLRSEVDSDLTLALQQDADGASGRVTGTVTVVRSSYREPLAVVAGLLSGLRTSAAAAPAAAASAASRLALDVRLLTDSDIVVDNNLARVQLGGDLRVIGTAAAPALAGRAVVREGGQLFLGNNVYTLEAPGTIDFADPVAIVPDLNLTAATRAGGHDIELVIDGRPEDLEVQVRSLTDPALGQADVASLLLTGRVLDDVAGAEGDIVREQVLGYLSGDVLGIAGRTIGLDTLRLGGPDLSTLRRDPAAVAAETDPTSRLTFGKALRDNIELTYSQSLREGDAQTWIVDYLPFPQANIRFVADDDNLGTFEFRHDLSLGGGAADRRAEPRPPPAASRVSGVTFAGDLGLPEPQLRDTLRLNAGDRFDFGAWQGDRDRLEETLHGAGRFEARVAAERAEGGEGVALAYDIEAGPPTSILVTGHTLPGDVVRRIERAWSQSVSPDFLREEAAAIVRGALIAEGYLEPAVDTRLADGATKELRITVEPGARTAARRLAIEAGDDALQRDLEAWAALQDPDAGWTEPMALSDALVAELRARGRLDARVELGSVRVEGATAVRPVTVTAGPQFVVGDVRFAGAARVEAERLRAAAALAPGAPYRPADVERARRAVDGLYRSEGFPRTRVTVGTRVEADGPRVSLEFGVDEGPRQVLRDVRVVGNRSTDTGVIARTLGVSIGEPIGVDAWLEARARLFDTGLFRRVDVTLEPIADAAGGGDQDTQLLVTVEEWPALRIRYGLQVSEERPEGSVEGRDLRPGFSADLTRRTLFGRPVSVGAAFEYQRRERLARAFLTAPTLFGRRVESLFSAERSNRQYASDDLVTDLTGLAWEQRVRSGPLQLSYAYRFDRNHTFETEPDSPLDPVFDLTVNIARLTGGAVFDSRDDPTETRRGWLLSSNTETSLEALGSDLGFVRQLAQAYYFRPWRGVVFASAGRFGIVSPLAGQEVIPSELFFAGGPRTVRGVAEDSLGPRDIFGDPAGGRVLLVMNQEVRFPIARWFRGVGFVDAGNVFSDPGSVDLGRLVTSVGGGLRVDTPFVLLRLDYGRAWTNTGDVRRSEWTFGIGHTF